MSSWIITITGPASSSVHAETAAKELVKHLHLEGEAITTATFTHVASSPPPAGVQLAAVQDQDQVDDLTKSLYE